MPSTRSAATQQTQDPAPAPAPDPAPAPAPAKRPRGRPPKRKPDTIEEASQTGPSPPAGNKAKKRKTAASSNPPPPAETAEPSSTPSSASAAPAPSSAQPPAPSSAQPPAPSSAQPPAPSWAQPPASSSAQPPALPSAESLTPPAEPRSVLPALANPLTSSTMDIDFAQAPASGPSSAAPAEPPVPTTSGSNINTRNRENRAPTLRELMDQNEALQNQIEALKEKLKQANSDIRVLKKFKVLWFNEYAKKKNDSDPATAAAAATAPAALIPRPPGEKGKNGWNLQEAMSLKDDDGLYAEILRTARHCISRSGLDWDSTYSEQDPGRLAACFRELKKQQPYLERFQGDWPAKEMVISALQNRRKTRTAKTKAKLATDQATQHEMARVDEALAAE